MPAKVIANPIAVLGLHSKDFTQGLSNAISAVKGFASDFTSGIGSTVSALAKFSGIGGVVAGVVGSIGVGALVNSQMDAIDSTAKLSDRLGIATEDLTGLQHAADLSGVSNEALAGGLTHLQKNMVDAANGGKETSAAFAALGLNAKDLANLPTDQAVGKIADSLNNVQNPAQKAAIQMKIFGKTGAELNPLLAEGSKGLAEMSKEASDLGLSYSRVDAGKVEEANDSITRLKDVFKGIANQIAIGIAPGITYVATAFTGLGIKVVAIFKNILPPLIETIGGIYDMVVAYVTPVFDWLSNNTGAIVDFISQVLAVGITFIGDVFSALYGVVVYVFEGIGNVLSAAGVNVQTAGGVFTWLRDTVVGVFTVVGYVIKNWQLSIEIAGLAVALQIVTVGNIIADVFTNVVPTYLAWFAGNWQDIFTTLFNFTASVFTNMGKNVENFFSALWSFLKGGDFNFQWTGLLDGFTSTIKELPKIAEREVGPLEQGLRDQLAASTGKFQDGLTNHLIDQDKLTQNIKKGVENATKSPEIAKSAKPKAPTFDSSKDLSTDKAKKDKKFDTNIETGSAESLALRDMTTPSNDFGSTGSTPEVDTPAAIRETADTTQTQLTMMYELLKKYLPFLDDIANGQDFTLDQVTT